MGLIAMTAETARRIGEIGFIIGAIGGLLFIAGAAFRANSARESTSHKVLMGAGICITIGFILGIVAFHWGR